MYKSHFYPCTHDQYIYVHAHTQLAMDNEKNIKKGGFGGNFVEFTYAMYSRNDSKHCLSRDNCLPVGGYSVWTTFQDYNINASQMHNTSIQSENQLLLATTSMDSTCLFHDKICRGGNANIAGLVGWLAAIEAMSHIKEVLSESEKIEKQIIFAAFEGESYDMVGSRKFVYDVQNGSFECDTPMTIGDSGYGCWQPYASSLDFKKLNFSNIVGIVELSQIGMAEVKGDGDGDKVQRIIYAHYERNQDAAASTQVASMMHDAAWIAAQIASQESMGFAVKCANSSGLPGTPPSAYWSFLNGDIDATSSSRSSLNIPGIVFTDHEMQYKNAWYHSVYDSYYNKLNIEQICMASTLYARLLYKLSLKNASRDYNESFVSANINANCLLLEQLLECFLLDMSCDLLSNLSPNSKHSRPSQYASVYRIIEDQDIGGASKFVFRFVANLTRKSNDKTFGSCSSNKDCAGKGYVCGASNAGQACMDSSTYFHSAVDVNLQFDYDSNRWHLINQSINHHTFDTLIWTESMWNKNIGSRFYEKESNQTQVTILLAGIAMLAANLIITWRFKIYCKHKFPYLSRG